MSRPSSSDGVPDSHAAPFRDDDDDDTTPAADMDDEPSDTEASMPFEQMTEPVKSTEPASDVDHPVGQVLEAQRSALKHHRSRSSKQSADGLTRPPSVVSFPEFDSESTAAAVTSSVSPVLRPSTRGRVSMSGGFSRPGTSAASPTSPSLFGSVDDLQPLERLSPTHASMASKPRTPADIASSRSLYEAQPSMRSNPLRSLHALYAMPAYQSLSPQQQTAYLASLARERQAQLDAQRARLDAADGEDGADEEEASHADDSFATPTKSPLHRGGASGPLDPLMRTVAFASNLGRDEAQHVDLVHAVQTPGALANHAYVAATAPTLGLRVTKRANLSPVRPLPPVGSGGGGGLVHSASVPLMPRAVAPPHAQQPQPRSRSPVRSSTHVGVSIASGAVLTHAESLAALSYAQHGPSPAPLWRTAHDPSWCGLRAELGDEAEAVFLDADYTLVSLAPAARVGKAAAAAAQAGAEAPVTSEDLRHRLQTMGLGSGNGRARPSAAGTTSTQRPSRAVRDQAAAAARAHHRERVAAAGPPKGFVEGLTPPPIPEDLDPRLKHTLVDVQPSPLPSPREEQELQQHARTLAYTQSEPNLMHQYHHQQQHGARRARSPPPPTAAEAAVLALLPHSQLARHYSATGRVLHLRSGRELEASAALLDSQVARSRIHVSSLATLAGPALPPMGAESPTPGTGAGSGGKYSSVWSGSRVSAYAAAKQASLPEEQLRRARRHFDSLPPEFQSLLSPPQLHQQTTSKPSKRPTRATHLSPLKTLLSTEHHVPASKLSDHNPYSSLLLGSLRRGGGGIDEEDEKEESMDHEDLFDGDGAPLGETPPNKVAYFDDHGRFFSWSQPPTRLNTGSPQRMYASGTALATGETNGYAKYAGSNLARPYSGHSSQGGYSSHGGVSGTPPPGAASGESSTNGTSRTLLPLRAHDMRPAQEARSKPSHPHLPGAYSHSLAQLEVLAVTMATKPPRVASSTGSKHANNATEDDVDPNNTNGNSGTHAFLHRASTAGGGGGGVKRDTLSSAGGTRVNTVRSLNVDVEPLSHLTEAALVAHVSRAQTASNSTAPSQRVQVPRADTLGPDGAPLDPRTAVAFGFREERGDEPFGGSPSRTRPPSAGETHTPGGTSRLGTPGQLQRHRLRTADQLRSDMAAGTPGSISSRLHSASPSRPLSAGRLVSPYGDAHDVAAPFAVSLMHPITEGFFGNTSPMGASATPSFNGSSAPITAPATAAATSVDRMREQLASSPPPPSTAPSAVPEAGHISRALLGLTQAPVSTLTKKPPATASGPLGGRVRDPSTRGALWPVSQSAAALLAPPTTFSAPSSPLMPETPHSREERARALAAIASRRDAEEAALVDAAIAALLASEPSVQLVDGEIVLVPRPRDSLPSAAAAAVLFGPQADRALAAKAAQSTMSAYLYDQRQRAAAVRIQALTRGRRARKDTLQKRRESVIAPNGLFASLGAAEVIATPQQPPRTAPSVAEPTTPVAGSSSPSPPATAPSPTPATSAAHHAAATKIQALTRGRAARRRTLRAQDAASSSAGTVAAAADGGAEDAEEYSVEQHSAAVKLQAIQRGRAVRRKRRHKRNASSNALTVAPAVAAATVAVEHERQQKEHVAATKIQALQRGRAARRRHAARMAPPSASLPVPAPVVAPASVAPAAATTPPVMRELANGAQVLEIEHIYSEADSDSDVQHSDEEDEDQQQQQQQAHDATKENEEQTRADASEIAAPQPLESSAPTDLLQPAAQAQTPATPATES